MSIEVKETGKNQVSISIRVSADEFKEATGKVFRKNVKSISVPGFRKGKAPRSIIERMYGKEVFYEDAINEILPDKYENAVKEAGLDVVSQPKIDIADAKDIKIEEGFTFTAEVFVKPVFTVADYKGIAAKKVVYTVKDELIDAEISRVRERNARIIPVEDRGIENGDTANIDYEGFVDGVPFEGGKGENHDLVIGSGQFIPGFEEQLTGKGENDDALVKVTFPSDYHAEELKGKDAEFKVKINKVTTKELPEVDDEFAKDVSEFDTIDEYRASIKEKIEKNNEIRSDQGFENDIVSKVCESVEVDIPECMINERVEALARDFDNNMMQQGINRQLYLQYTGMDEATFLGQFKANAETQVKSRLVLEAIAKQENIEASDADVDAELDKISSHYGMDKEKITQYVSVDEIKNDIVANKTVDFLKENAVCEEVSEEENKDTKPAKKATAAKKPAAKKAPAEKTEKAEKVEKTENTDEEPKKKPRKKASVE